MTRLGVAITNINFTGWVSELERNFQKRQIDEAATRLDIVVDTARMGGAHVFKVPTYLHTTKRTSK